MDELYRMKKDAVEELKDSLRDYPDNDEHDTIHEIADSSVPVYTYDLLQLAANNLDLAVVEPEIGPAFDGSPTPVNIIAANIYEEITQELWNNLDNIKAELEDELDECFTCGDKFEEGTLIEIEGFLICKDCNAEDDES